MIKYNLSLDNALNHSGYAIFQNDKLIKCGVIDASKEQTTGQKILYLYNSLQSILNIFEITNIFFEDCQYQSNQKTYKSLSEVQGVITLFCEQNNVKYEILSPSHWRKILQNKYGMSWGRKRAEQKECAINFIKNEFNIDVNSDTSDAICIGLAANIERSANEAAF